MCAKISELVPRDKKPCLDDKDVKDLLVNDSLGTVDQADSTGTDEKKETGDAKKNNFPTKED